MRRWLPVLFVMVFTASVEACLWDQDTPEWEGLGMPEVVAAITGRFERNPPLYFEMRLARVSAELAKSPEMLASYHDAGVACDRLGRGDAAISWMKKKRVQLDRLDPARLLVKEQLYRYHANLGTFLVHRWLRQGADRARLDEVRAARDEIAKAIEINANAHFGRENYQLLAIEWILAPPKLAPGSSALPNLLGWKDSQIYDHSVDPQAADDAVRGLAGLVVLGNAWESVDVFHALEVALQFDSVGFEQAVAPGRNSLAYLAWSRCRELIDAGKGTMIPGAPIAKKLKELLPAPAAVGPDNSLTTAFVKLRAEADAWHAARVRFMMERLEAGRHPDTDPAFWEGYKPARPPALPGASIVEAAMAKQGPRERQEAATAAVALVIVSAMILTAIRLVRKSGGLAIGFLRRKGGFTRDQAAS